MSASPSSSTPGGIEPAVVERMAETVAVGEGAIVSRTLVKTGGGSVTAFAFDGGQALSEHTAPFDALVHVLEGGLVVTIAGSDHEIGPGEAILMPAQIPHAVGASEPSRWLLTMLKA